MVSVSLRMVFVSLRMVSVSLRMISVSFRMMSVSFRMVSVSFRMVSVSFGVGFSLFVFVSSAFREVSGLCRIMSLLVRGSIQKSVSLLVLDERDGGSDAMHCVSTTDDHRSGLGANCCVTTTPRVSTIFPNSKKIFTFSCIIRHIYIYICRVVKSPMFNLKPF